MLTQFIQNVYPLVFKLETYFNSFSVLGKERLLWTAGEANVVQGRVVRVADSAVVRLDAGLQSTDALGARLAVLAPDSIRVSHSVDFALVGAQESDVVGRRPVPLGIVRPVERQLDSQSETGHVRDNKGRWTRLDSLEISGAVRI
jgi:hypothetical protein